MSIPWDPVLHDRLTRLHLLARQIVWGMTSGNHRSNRVTQSIEFVEHKVYQPGDPLSSIDWRVFARTDKLMVKKQQAETNSDVVLVLDASADMQTGHTGKLDWTESKMGKALTSLSALTLLSDRRGDAVGLWVCGGSEETRGLNGWIPCSGTSIQPIFHRLANVELVGQNVLSSDLQQLAQRLRKRSIVIIVSDWMEDPDGWGPQLELLSSMGHDVRCLQLFSKIEWDLELPESIKVYGFENHNEVPLDTRTMQELFKSEVNLYCKEVDDWAARSNVVWVRSALEDDLLPPLIHLVKGLRL